MTIAMKELLLHHVDHTFATGAMQPSLGEAVRGLTAAQAAWKPSSERHSIWQVVRHVIHWKEAAIAALDGHPLDYDERNRADWQEVAGDKQDWERDVAHLQAISREIRTRAESMDDESLSQGIKWYKHSKTPRRIALRLLELATHDVYHGGQIQYLVALQEIPVEQLASAASRNDVGRMARLLAAHPDAVHGYGRDGWTALHVACYFGMTEAVRLLLSRGAAANAVSCNDAAQTPLHLTAGGIANRVDIVRLLLDSGADASVRDAKGRTAMDVAREDGHTDVASLLGQGLLPGS